MSKDIRFNIDEYKLVLRAAGFIINDNKILLHKDTREEYYALIGGAIQLGEKSEETIKREFFEETGKEIEIKKQLKVIENFFIHKETKYHEILFIYELDFKNDENKNMVENIVNVEGKDYLKYKWIDIDKLKDFDIRPKEFVEELYKYIKR